MMSWTQQVWHVFRKDVWEQRWVLGLYGALLLLGTLEGVGALPYGIGTDHLRVAMPASLLLRGVAAYLAAVIVLADSPSVPRAYWGALPLARSAVFSAKALFLVVIVLCALLALVPPLLYMAAPPAQLLLQLLNVGVVFAAFLAATAAFAALVPHLRMVLLLYVVIVSATVVSTLLLAGNGPPATFTTPSWITLAGTALAIASLAAIYRTRKTSRWRKAVALLGGTALLLLSIGAADIAPGVEVIAPERVTGVSASFEWEPTSDGSRSRRWAPTVAFDMTGTLQVDNAAPSERVELQTTEMRVTTSRGTNHALGVSYLRVLFEPPLPVANEIKWLVGSPSDALFGPGGWLGTMRAYASDDNADSIAVASLTIARTDGEMQFFAPRLLGTVSLHRDTSFAHAGRRFEVEPSYQTGWPVIYYRLLAMRTNRGVLYDSRASGRLAFALVNSERREAVRMYTFNRQTSDWGSVLAPMSVERAAGLLEFSSDANPVDSPARQALRDSEWLQGAQLMIYEWVLTGTSPFSVSSSAADAGRGTE